MDDPVLEEIKSLMYGLVYRTGWLMAADVAVSFAVVAASPTPAPWWTYAALAAAGAVTLAGIALLIRRSRAGLEAIERRETGKA